MVHFTFDQLSQILGLLFVGLTGKHDSGLQRDFTIIKGNHGIINQCGEQ